MDILPFLSRMSKIFQCHNVDFSTISPIVDSTIHALNDMNESRGIYVEMLDVCLVKKNEKVVYQRKVSESIRCNLNEFGGFESHTAESNDSGLRGVEVSYYKQQNSPNVHNADCIQLE